MRVDELLELATTSTNSEAAHEEQHLTPSQALRRFFFGPWHRCEIRPTPRLLRLCRCHGMTAIGLTPAQHEARIDMAWRHLITCATANGRATFCRAFLGAIHERNADRTPEHVRQLERERGLRA